MIFVTKQENLRGTDKLHALVHIFVPRSDAQAKLADSISWYGWSFMQTNGLICVLPAKKRKCYGGWPNYKSYGLSTGQNLSSGLRLTLVASVDNLIRK